MVRDDASFAAAFVGPIILPPDDGECVALVEWYRAVENRSTRRSIPTASLTTINPTWTTVGAKPATKNLKLENLIIRVAQCVLEGFSRRLLALCLN
jgi:hypothetical protein